MDQSAEPVTLAPALPDGALHHDPTTPRLVAAMAGSVAMHTVILAVLVLVTGLDASLPGPPLDRVGLRATLVTPTPAPIASRESMPVPTLSSRRPAASAPKIAPLPLLSNVDTPAPVPELSEGGAAVLPDDGSPIDPALEATIAAIYPGADRGIVEFDVPPAPRYPSAARAERRQVFLRVPAVVKEDGSVEVAEGTFDDPLFGDAIREALAAAKAPPPIVDGSPRAMWTLLTFYFEFYAGGESQRTKYEERK